MYRKKQGVGYVWFYLSISQYSYNMDKEHKHFQVLRKAELTEAMTHAKQKISND